MFTRQVALPTAVVALVAGAFSILQSYAVLLRDWMTPGLWTGPE